MSTVYATISELNRIESSIKSKAIAYATGLESGRSVRVDTPMSAGDTSFFNSSIQKLEIIRRNIVSRQLGFNARNNPYNTPREHRHSTHQALNQVDKDTQLMLAVCDRILEQTKQLFLGITPVSDKQIVEGIFELSGSITNFAKKISAIQSYKDNSMSKELCMEVQPAFQKFQETVKPTTPISSLEASIALISLLLTILMVKAKSRQH